MAVPRLNSTGVATGFAARAANHRDPNVMQPPKSTAGTLSPISFGSLPDRSHYRGRVDNDVDALHSRWPLSNEVTRMAIAAAGPGLDDRPL